MSKILIIAAHPDDEIVGAGGTWHKREKGFGDKIETLILDKGRSDKIDQKYDTFPIVHWISTLEKRVLLFKPDIIYTHVFGDINKDHQVIHQAMKVACRPTRSSVKRIYGFNSTLSPFDAFHPTHFEVLSQYDMDWKIEQMRKLYSEEMNLPYRDEEGLITQAMYWGNQIGVKYAEAFETIIDIR